MSLPIKYCTLKSKKPYRRSYVLWLAKLKKLHFVQTIFRLIQTGTHLTEVCPHLNVKEKNNVVYQNNKCIMYKVTFRTKSFPFEPQFAMWNPLWNNFNPTTKLMIPTWLFEDLWNWNPQVLECDLRQKINKQTTL